MNNISNEKKWVELHIHLQDLLAGYIDDELDQQEKLIIEAHLAGCESCRSDVVRQQLITQRLNKLPLERLPPEMHLEIDNTLSDSLTSSDDIKHRARPVSIFTNWCQHIYTPRFFAASGWSVALLLIVVLLYPSLSPENSPRVPMVEDVLAEYLHLDKTSLPASDTNSKSSLPANWPNAHLLTSWDTTVGGAPAKAFAMRNGDKIIIQYRVDEAVFFRNPKVRQSVADSGSYLSKKNDIQVLAMPLKDAGLLVVGPVEWMPSPEKITLVKT